MRVPNRGGKPNGFPFEVRKPLLPCGENATELGKTIVSASSLRNLSELTSRKLTLAVSGRMAAFGVWFSKYSTLANPGERANDWKLAGLPGRIVFGLAATSLTLLTVNV